MQLLLRCAPHCFPSHPLFPQSSYPINFHNVIFFTRNQNARRLSSCRLQLCAALPITDHELLQILTESDAFTGKTRAHLPAVRSYETDLARLTLIGSVSFDQALIAAAADGGEAADEHLSVGTSTMVVETVFPSGCDEHSTVSTRLFLPAEMVKDKAKKLRSLARNIFYSKDTVSKNILAMTFRQVVLQRLWSFQLTLFYPGTERNMEDLGNTREAQAGFVVSSSDEKFISSLAEVVSCCALQSARSNYISEAGGLHSKYTFRRFQKPPKNSIDSSISICRISESEVEKEASDQVEKYKLMKGKYVNRSKKAKYNWWLPPDFLRLDLIGGPGFGSWTCEFIPAYRLQINTNIFKDVKLEGCHNLADNRWEVLLTHYQMVELANILDMFYEDRYTMPNKKLLSNMFAEVPITLKSKNKPWKLLFAVFAGGCTIMIFGVLAQLCWSKHTRKVSELKNVHSLPVENCSHLISLENAELEALCIAIIKKIKDEFGWSEELVVDKNIGVWTGALPSYLRKKGLMMDAISSEVPPILGGSSSESHAELSPSVDYPLEAGDLELQKTAADIATYQAVLTKDGKLIGFQPTNRVAVNHWSSNPLAAKSLYGVHKLSPGLFEPRLNIPHPRDAIPIELLMSINPECRFALATPMQ